MRDCVIILTAVNGTGVSHGPPDRPASQADRLIGALQPGPAVGESQKWLVWVPTTVRTCAEAVRPQVTLSGQLTVYDTSDPDV